MGGDADGFGDLAWVVVHQRDVGGLDRGVGAGRTHRDAEVRFGQRGRVVDTVADHPHGSGRGDELGDDTQFVVGQQIAACVVDAGLVGDGGGRSLVVAGEHDRGHAQRLEIIHGLAAVRAQRVGDSEHGDRGRVHEHDRGLCVVLQPFQDRFEFGTAHPGLFGEAVVTQRVHGAGDAGAHTAPGDCFEPLSGVERAVVRGDDRVGHRMLGKRLDRRRDPQDLVIGQFAEVDEVGEHRGAVGQGAGLVERNGADLAGVLEVHTAFDQDAAPGCAAEPGDHRDRGGDDECAWAGEHEQHECSVEPVAEAAVAGDHRHDGDDEGHDEHSRRIDGCEAVDEALGWGLVGLGFLDRTGDPIECAFALGGSDGDLQGAALVDRAGEHRITDRFRHGDRLSGDRCLVHRTRPGGDAPVEGDAFARLDQDHRVQRHIPGRNADPATVTAHARRLGSETDK